MEDADNRIPVIGQWVFELIRDSNFLEYYGVYLSWSFAMKIGVVL